MADNTIGAVTFKRLTVQPQERQERLEKIRRPGVDGNAWRKLGEEGEPFQAMAIKELSAANLADSTFLTYKAMIGETVSVTDIHGNVYTNCVVEAVRRTFVQEIGVEVGWGGNALLHIEFLLTKST